KNLTSDETRFNALRRCDRGTDAMHLANTPVVSPESKNPALRGFCYIQIVAFCRCRVAQLCQA
ncbi:type 2 lanthipeptide synthetase LanM, partial [Klebsiella michiganensis]